LHNDLGKDDYDEEQQDQRECCQSGNSRQVLKPLLTVTQVGAV
jgi:hypothetical protein